MAITFYDSQGTITSVVEPTSAAQAGLLLGQGFNEFNEAAVTPLIETVVYSKIISLDQAIYIGSWTVWADIDVNYVLKADAQIIGGVRSSPSRLSETIGYAAPIRISGPVFITITAQHWGSVSELIKVNMTGSINTNQ